MLGTAGSAVPLCGAAVHPWPVMCWVEWRDREMGCSGYTHREVGKGLRGASAPTSLWPPQTVRDESKVWEFTRCDALFIKRNTRSAFHGIRTCATGRKARRSTQWPQCSLWGQHRGASGESDSGSGVLTLKGSGGFTGFHLMLCVIYPYKRTKYAT